jgi:hypothetical protein
VLFTRIDIGVKALGGGIEPFTVSAFSIEKEYKTETY